MRAHQPQTTTRVEAAAQSNKRSSTNADKYGLRCNSAAATTAAAAVKLSYICFWQLRV